MTEIGNYTSGRDISSRGVDLFAYESLDHFSRRSHTYSGIHSIEIGKFVIDVLVENNNSDLAVVSYHAALSPREKYKLPVFTGQSVTSGKCSRIFIADPCLCVDDSLTLAWYAGAKGFPLQEILLSIIRDLCSAMGSQRLIFFGSSGGGFAALYYSSFFDSSLAIVANPQTDINFYYKSFVRHYMNACFRTSSEDQITHILENEIGSDLCALYASKMKNFVIYFQNASDQIHVEHHLEPFQRALRANSDAEGRFKLMLGSWGDGHVAPPPDILKNVVGRAITWEGDWGHLLERV